MMFYAGKMKMARGIGDTGQAAVLDASQIRRLNKNGEIFVEEKHHADPPPPTMVDNITLIPYSPTRKQDNPFSNVKENGTKQRISLDTKRCNEYNIT